MEYSILLGGFAAVLSDGRAAFLTMESPRQEPRVSKMTLSLFTCQSVWTYTLSYWDIDQTLAKYL